MKKSFLPALKTLWKILDKKQKLNFCITFVLCATRAISILSFSQVIACLTAKLLGEPTCFFGILLPASWSVGAVIAFNLCALGALWSFSTFARGMQKKIVSSAKLTFKERAIKMLLTPRKNMDLKKSVGEITYIIQSSSECVGDFLEIFLIEVFPYFISAVVALIYLATINIYVSLGALLLSIIIYLISLQRSKMDKRHFINIDSYSSKVNNHITNCINNLPFIVFINSAYHEQNLIKEQSGKVYKEVKKQSRILFWYWTILYALEYAFMGVSLYLLIKYIGIAALGVNTLILVVSYLDKTFSPINDLGHFTNVLNQLGFKVCQINEFAIASDEIFSSSIDFKKENKILSKQKINKIEIKNMDIAIGNLNKKNINATFEANKLTCIVGPSGSGKTTLIGCLIGIKEYQKGKIIVNDKHEVKSLFYNSSKIAITFQNSSIFDRSVMDNICYPQNEPNAKALKGIQRFNLTEIINRTENLNSSINLDNVLSGGEKKRISFVRATSRPAEIYIFDEPTNDLDNDNVNKVILVIKSLKKKNIVIVISHDDRLIKISDQIYKI